MRIARPDPGPWGDSGFHRKHRHVLRRTPSPDPQHFSQGVENPPARSDNCPKTSYEQFGAWPKDDEGLADPRRAKIVRAGNDGAPITYRVFPEAKEFLAGYWIVDVETPDQASAAPGPEIMPIEVRQAMSGPPDDLL